MKHFILSVALAITTLVASAMPQSSPTPPSDSEIRKILSDRIDRDHQSVGIVVGVIDSTGRHVINYGTLDKNDSRPLDGNTLFELGSVTKVFT
jgi:serine-type D-Ala-D-Ala carboxypeptidase/endopeptidase